MCEGAEKNIGASAELFYKKRERSTLTFAFSEDIKSRLVNDVILQSTRRSILALSFSISCGIWKIVI